MPFPIAAAIAGAASLGGQLIQRIGQKKENRRIYEQSLRDQKAVQAEQREYDKPKQQMARFLEAGLNPHLIYGGGSSNSGGSFAFNPAQQQAVQEPNYGQASNAFIGAQQAQAQLAYTQTRTAESGLKQQALSLQNEIAKTNPMLNPNVYHSVIDMMEQVNSTKAHEAYILGTMGETGTTPIFRKIQAEVAALEQKLGLNTSDLAIKNKIFESKEYENAIKEIQMRWLTDAEITPEHIRQGLMMLLQQMIPFASKLLPSAKPR